MQYPKITARVTFFSRVLLPNTAHTREPLVSMRKFAFATHVGPNLWIGVLIFIVRPSAQSCERRGFWRTTLIIRVCSGAEGPLSCGFTLFKQRARQRNVCADREKLKGNWNGNILITLRVLIKIFPLARVPFAHFVSGILIQFADDDIINKRG